VLLRGQIAAAVTTPTQRDMSGPMRTDFVDFAVAAHGRRPGRLNVRFSARAPEGVVPGGRLGLDQARAVCRGSSTSVLCPARRPDVDDDRYRPRRRSPARRSPRRRRRDDDDAPAEDDDHDDVAEAEHDDAPAGHDDHDHHSADVADPDDDAGGSRRRRSEVPTTQVVATTTPTTTNTTTTTRRRRRGGDGDHDDLISILPLL
jgi:hypothetical protein